VPGEASFRGLVGHELNSGLLRGDFSDAKVIKKFGDVPGDLSAL
jgi:hypothetical protein